MESPCGQCLHHLPHSREIWNKTEREDFLCKLQKKIHNVLSTELCKILCICILSYQSERKTIIQKTTKWKTASPLMEERRQTEYEQFPKLTRSLIPPSPHILQGSVCMSLIPVSGSSVRLLDKSEIERKQESRTFSKATAFLFPWWNRIENYTRAGNLEKLNFASPSVSTFFTSVASPIMMFFINYEFQDSYPQVSNLSSYSGITINSRSCWWHHRLLHMLFWCQLHPTSIRDQN